MTPATLGRRRQRGALLAAVAILFVAPSLAAAQTASPCDALLDDAEEHYVNREFSEAEDLVTRCLAIPGLPDEMIVEAYRRLALIHLRQDEYAPAREAVLRLLGVSFQYEPDPVQDPPAYVALVSTVKDQLRLAEGRVARPDSLILLPPAARDDIADGSDLGIVRPPSEERDAGPPVVEREAARPNNGMRRWLMIGGGVVAATLAGVLLTGGSDAPPGGDGPLPGPPPLPN